MLAQPALSSWTQLQFSSTRRTIDHTEIVVPTHRLRYNSELNLLTTNPSQHTTITATPWIIRHLALKRLISTLYRHNFNPHGRSYPSKGWQLSHLSLRHLSRTSLARVILASILICFDKNFFCCDRILFRIFHSFLTFTLKEPFLSRRKYFSTGLLLIPFNCF